MTIRQREIPLKYWRFVKLILVLLLLMGSCAGAVDPQEPAQPLAPVILETPSPVAAVTMAVDAVADATPTSTATSISSEQASPTPTDLPVQATPTEPPPTAEPVPMDTPAPRYQPPASSIALEGFAYIQQTWNNCGPATLAMQLSYFGSQLSQATIGAALRTHPDDKNVGPVELAEYARSQGFHALVRVNGNRQLMQTLITNGIPPIIETWLEPDPGDGLGHYRLLTGYDDAAQNWIGYDSYYRVNLVNPGGDYRGIRMAYAETDALWKAFNRTYVIVYTASQAPMVAAILGEDRDDLAMWQRALATAQQEVAANNNDAFAWFNLGTSLTALGNYTEAANAFDRAQAIGLPWRMLWYQFGPFHAYYEAGRYHELIALADSVLKPSVQIEELHDWRARAYDALGDPTAAAAARQRVAELNQNYRALYAEVPRAGVGNSNGVAGSVEPGGSPAAAVATPLPVDSAAFVDDITVPDGTTFSPGEAFLKTWRVRNSGDKNWDNYTLQFVTVDAPDNHRMGSPDSVPVERTSAGQSVDISVPLVAPSTPGNYTGYWQIVSEDGGTVQGGQVWAIIQVEER
jgi:tetratricopeptide (TPR) repeat protein